MYLDLIFVLDWNYNKADSTFLKRFGSNFDVNGISCHANMCHSPIYEESFCEVLVDIEILWNIYPGKPVALAGYYLSAFDRHI